LSAHKKHISTSLLREVSGSLPPREATSAEPHSRGYSGRHAASRDPRRSIRNRWAAGAVAVAAVGAVAALAATTPWAGGTGLADAARAGQASPFGRTTSAHGGGQATTSNSTSVQKAGQPAVARMATDRPTASGSPSPSRTGAKPAPTKTASTATHASAAPTQDTSPVMFYDSVEPGVLPAGQAAAVYADGPFATTSASVAGHGNVLWIDVNGSDPNANVLDVEPGDASPATAASWASARLTANPDATAIIYTFIAEWPSVIDEIDTLPSSMRSHVKYWISDPTGVPHILSGASATQWAWGSQYDSDEAEPGFFA
jgi:hypothetical protein